MEYDELPFCLAFVWAHRSLADREPLTHTESFDQALSCLRFSGLPVDRNRGRRNRAIAADLPAKLLWQMLFDTNAAP